MKQLFIKLKQFIMAKKQRRTSVFYNTININGDELRQAISNCKSQDDRIIAIFQTLPEGTKLTKWMVNDIYNDHYGYIQEGSITRSMGTLGRTGRLIMLDEMIQERRGAMNHLFILNPNPPTETEVAIPKFLKIKNHFSFNSEGKVTFDIEKLVEELDIVINQLETKFN
jgi:hypothetical protein